MKRENEFRRVLKSMRLVSLRSPEEESHSHIDPKPATLRALRLSERHVTEMQHISNTTGG